MPFSNARPPEGSFPSLPSKLCRIEKPVPSGRTANTAPDLNAPTTRLRCAVQPCPIGNKMGSGKRSAEVCSAATEFPEHFIITSIGSERQQGAAAGVIPVRAVVLAASPCPGYSVQSVADGKTGSHGAIRHHRVGRQNGEAR